MVREALKSIVKGGLRVVRPLMVDPQEFVLVPSGDTGSLGDQAMVDATRAVLTGEFGYGLSILHFSGIAAPFRLRGPVRYLTSSPGKADSSVRERLARTRAVSAVRAGVVGHIGADVADGVYKPQMELAKLDFFADALRAGAKVGVFGFSMSKTPAPAVMARLKAMPELRMHLRDRISLRRFEEHVGRTAPLVADVAFLLEPGLTSPEGKAAHAWVEGQKAAGRQVLAVNISGHTLEKIEGGDGEAAHAALLRDWLVADEARAILFVPHDTRPPPVGDVGPVERCWEAVRPAAPDRIHMVRPPFEAWEVKALAGAVDAVMTGRMHFAIASFGMGTPALCVVYQGKYEGLMDHFGVDGLLIEPPELLDRESMTRRLAGFMTALPDFRARVAARLPDVKSLSRKNFDWLR